LFVKLKKNANGGTHTMNGGLLCVCNTNLRQAKTNVGIFLLLV